MGPAYGEGVPRASGSEKYRILEGVPNPKLSLVYVTYQVIQSDFFYPLVGGHLTFERVI